MRAYARLSTLKRLCLAAVAQVARVVAHGARAHVVGHRREPVRLGQLRERGRAVLIVVKLDAARSGNDGWGLFVLVSQRVIVSDLINWAGSGGGFLSVRADTPC